MFEVLDGVTAAIANLAVRECSAVDCASDAGRSTAFHQLEFHGYYLIEIRCLERLFAAISNNC